MTDKRIDDYLRKSTRGLWRHKRLEVKEELSAHIEGRVNAHLIAGLSEQEAIEKTLAELGQPKVVSTGMARLYTLPIMAGSGFILAICCALTVLLLNASTAQILSVSSLFPSEECRQLKNPSDSNCATFDIWISTESLQKALEPQGVKISEQHKLVNLEFPSGEKYPITIQGDFINIEGRDIDSESGYITLNELIFGLALVPDSSIQIDGWEEPVLRINGVELQLSDKGSPVGGRFFYGSYFMNSFSNYSSDGLISTLYTLVPSFVEVSSWTPNANIAQIRLSDFQKGNVYGLLAILDPSDVSLLMIQTDIAFGFSVAPISDNGMLSFDVLSDDFDFNSDLKSLDINRTILVRLSGEFSNGKPYEIVSPERIKLE